MSTPGSPTADETHLTCSCLMPPPLWPRESEQESDDDSPTEPTCLLRCICSCCPWHSRPSTYSNKRRHRSQFLFVKGMQREKKHQTNSGRHDDQRTETSSPIPIMCQDTEALESKLVMLVGIISKCSTFQKVKNRCFFQNYTEDFSTLQASWEESKTCATIPGSKPLPPSGALSWNEGSTQPQESSPLPQLRPPTMSREYHSFKYNMPLLRDTIESESSLIRLAGDMWSKGLITDQVFEEISCSSGPLLKNKQLLLNSLCRQISVDAAHFHVILKILNKQPALENCCRKLGSFPDDDFVPITPIEKYAEHLKKVYFKGVLHPKWPPIEMAKYIKLITIEENTHRSIPMHAIFTSEDGHAMSRVLVEGGPGSGKSTFALELCTRWGKGEMFQQFSLVVLLPLRDKHVKRAKSLTDLFSTYFNKKEDQEEIVKAISSNEGEGVLLILEGFDELPTTEEHEETQYFLISQIFANIELPNATVLITTRPHISLPLHEYCIRNAQILQIVGFGEEEVKRYIEAAGLSTKQQSSLTEYLDLNPHIHKMVYNPLHCAILVQLYKMDGGTSAPKTSTQLYKELVKYLLIRYMKEKYGKLPTINWKNFPQSLPNPEYDEYTKLCELAYQEFIKGNLEIHVQNEFNHLGFMEASVAPFETDVTYHFLHQSVQEFFTASWIHQNYSSEEQLSLMTEKVSKPGHYENVLRFLAGLSNMLDWEELAKHAFADRKTLNVDSFYLNHDVLGLHLSFLSWLFENQDTKVCEKVLGKGTIGFFSKYYTTPFDYHAFAYCIANSVCEWEIQVQLPTVDWLDTFSKSFKTFQAAKSCGGTIRAIDVGHCQISKIGWDFLFSDSIHPLKSLQQLILYDTTLPPKALLMFPDHLSKLRHLRCLALSKTKFTERSATSLIEALPNTQITELHLCKTGIGLVDCQSLASHISDPQCRLKAVDLSYNDLTDKSVTVFTSALVHNSSLTKLNMSGSNFSHEGFNNLVLRLESRANMTPLTVLHLQHCHLPQGAIGYLCTALAKNKKCALESLGLSYIQESPKLSDIEALARLLETNRSLLILYLKSCSISAEGFSALSQSLHNNTTLCALYLAENEMSLEHINAVCKGFFSGARFSCENILNMPVTPLLCLDSYCDEWEASIIEIASGHLQMYYFFQLAKAKCQSGEPLPDIKGFMDVTNSREQKSKVCKQYVHLGEHTPACARDKMIEELRPSFVPTLSFTGL